MVFEQFPYQRPNLDLFAQEFEEKIGLLTGADSAESQYEIFLLLNAMRTDFLSMYNLCHIRHTINTEDAFYEQENNFYDRSMPVYQSLITRLYEAMLASPFRQELEQQLGRQFFTISDLSLRIFHPEVLEDLQEENLLTSEYVKLKAVARISYCGEEYNLSSIQPLELSPKRETRKGASEAKWSFYARHSERIESLYDQLVNVRHRIARKLGFENFIGLGYARLLRSDYTPQQVAEFRAQILEHVVPVTTRLFERQRRRLGLDKLNYYDEDFRFRSGNPQPKGDPQWIIGNASRMYAELSPETKDFFDFMRSAHLMDLETRPGKATGGYCTYIGAYKAPFIFSNFNGTSGDIDVLTHEAGHAFQVYASREVGVSDYQWPTMEACEIHSMSMEFFTWPWMDLFFGEDTGKYRFAHLANALYFMPYGVAVDEFQHFVYQHPEATPAERNQAWRQIEARYLPYRHYDSNAFLEEGGFWYKQSHIFTSPFYYIDYVLAQVCALQFWKRSQEDRKGAWADYLRLCRAGGSMSFLELVELAGLESPFAPGVIASVVQHAGNWLNRVDDSTF